MLVKELWGKLKKTYDTTLSIRLPAARNLWNTTSVKSCKSLLEFDINLRKAKAAMVAAGAASEMTEANLIERTLSTCPPSLGVVVDIIRSDKSGSYTTYEKVLETLMVKEANVLHKLLLPTIAAPPKATEENFHLRQGPSHIRKISVHLIPHPQQAINSCLAVGTPRGVVATLATVAVIDRIVVEGVEVSHIISDVPGADRDFHHLVQDQ